MRSGRRTGLFDFRLGSDIHVLIGCGLGGGSLINAAVGLRPDARVFADAAWPGEVREDGLLDQGFARANAMLRPKRYANAVRLHQISRARGGERLLRPASGRGARGGQLRADTSIRRASTQPACTLCGDCCSGCNVGAKNTVALTYLPDAKAHGAEIFTELTVSHVAKEGRHWRVHFAPTEEPDGAPRSVEARTVVLSAGTLGSTEILLRSREEGLAVSDSLGQRFSANGDIIAFALGGQGRVNGIGVGHPPKFVGDAIGACVTGEIELHDHGRLDHSMFIQEGVLPSALAPLLPVFFISGGRLLGAAQSLIKGVYQGPLQSLHTFFVVSHDDAKGRIRLENGKRADRLAECRRPAGLCPRRRGPEQGGGGCRRALHQEPARGDHHGHQAGNGASARRLRHGRGRAQAAWSITNARCSMAKADVHAGLYVCDGAIIPRSIGVNPLLTITALDRAGHDPFRPRP